MPRVTVPLSDAQARTLKERARAAQLPSDEILRDIVTTALDESSGDLEELDEAAVDQAFADFAAAYPDLCDALFAADPDLGTEHQDDSDADERQQFAEMPTDPADSGAATSEDADHAGSGLTSRDVDRAFGILADQYEEIAEDLFRGEESRRAGDREWQDIRPAAVGLDRTPHLFVLTKYLPFGSPAADASPTTDDLTNHVYVQLPSDKRNPRGIVVLVSRDHLEEIARFPKA